MSAARGRVVTVRDWRGNVWVEARRAGETVWASIPLGKNEVQTARALAAAALRKAAKAAPEGK